MSLGFDPSASSAPLLITAQEFADLMQISVRTLWRLSSARQIPSPLRLGGTVRWRREEVHYWIDQGCPTPQPRENGSRRK